MPMGCCALSSSRAGRPTRPSLVEAWRFHGPSTGSRLTFTVFWTTCSLYIFLAPLLYSKREVIMLDPTQLKRSIEEKLK